jgi:hypothetical protein
MPKTTNEIEKVIGEQQFYLFCSLRDENTCSYISIVLLLYNYLDIYVKDH